MLSSGRSGINSLPLRLEGQPDGKLWVYNPADGSITLLEASGSLTLPPNSSLFVIE
jgi:hypothetical protein